MTARVSFPSFRPRRRRSRRGHKKTPARGNPDSTVPSGAGAAIRDRTGRRSREAEIVSLTCLH